MNLRHLFGGILAGMLLSASVFLALVRWAQLHVFYVSAMRRCADGSLVNVLWPEDCAQWTSPWRGGLLWLAVALVVLALVLLALEARRERGR